MTSCVSYDILASRKLVRPVALPTTRSLDQESAAMADIELFSAVEDRKFSKQVSRQLLQAIVDGHYEPGGSLPSERDLSAAFDTSRVVIREALSSLSAKGLISVRQGRSTTINPVNEWNTLDPEVLLLLYGDDVFPRLVEMRRIVEPGLAALAAERATARELDSLREVAELPEDDDIERHVDIDTEFHLRIAEAAHNPVLLVTISAVNPLLRESRRRTFVVAGELPKARAWHKRIMEAIEKKDPDEARGVMAAHLDQVDDALSRYIGAEVDHQSASGNEDG